MRAKRKISEAGILFGIPAAHHWPERMEAVLSTLEIAHAKAREDAGATGVHAGFAAETNHLTQLLCGLAPSASDAFALAALVRYVKARRLARRTLSVESTRNSYRKLRMKMMQWLTDYLNDLGGGEVDQKLAA